MINLKMSAKRSFYKYILFLCYDNCLSGIRITVTTDDLQPSERPLLATLGALVSWVSQCVIAATK